MLGIRVEATTKFLHLLITRTEVHFMNRTETYNLTKKEEWLEFSRMLTTKAEYRMAR